VLGLKSLIVDQRAGTCDSRSLVNGLQLYWGGGTQRTGEY